MGKFILLLLCTLVLSACAAQQSLNDMKASKARYSNCLAQHPKDPSACAHEKELYEAASADYEGMGGQGNSLDAPVTRP